MKTYKQFISELNKFEKFLVKQGIKGVKKVFKDSFKNIRKSNSLNSKLRSDADNPFVSPRREAKSCKKFRTIPGQKGANIMKTKGGQYINYDPTRVRQGDGVRATGAFTMRGQSKAVNRFMDKQLKAQVKQVKMEELYSKM